MLNFLQWNEIWYNNKEYKDDGLDGKQKDKDDGFI